MDERLRPLTLGEILDQTAGLYRSRFMVFFGIGFIPAGTAFVFAAAIFGFIAWIGSVARRGTSVEDVFIWLFLILLLLLVIPVSLGTTALGSAAMSDAAARLFLGEKISIRDAYKKAWKRGWRYVGLYTLQSLVLIAVPIVVSMLLLIMVSIVRRMGVQARSDGGAALGGVILLVIAILVAYALLMLLRVCLSFPSCVVEQAGAWTAFRRSFALSKGTRGRILLLYILGTALNQMLALGFTIPAFIVLAFIPGLQGAAHSQTLGMIALFVAYGTYFAVRAFTKPIYGIALTLFYFDQRIRKEGFDIEWMMHQAGMLVPPPPQDPTLWLPPDGIARPPATQPSRTGVQSASPAAVFVTSVEMPAHQSLAEPAVADAPDFPHEE
jgi:hypothetical protein